MNSAALTTRIQPSPLATASIVQAVFENAVHDREIASVKKSFAYRSRLWLTGFSLSVGLTLSLLIEPLPRFIRSVEWGTELLGWVVLCLGAIIRIWASSYICARKSRDVVQAGPYSLCRNPLYWGTFLMIAAFPLLLRSPVLALSMIPPIVLYQLAVVPVEEAVMTNRHGEQYLNYCRTVNRWWPTISRFERGEPLDHSAIGYRRECLRLFWWLGLATALDSISAWESPPWWIHPIQWW